jgi:type IV secretion system protein TrbG
MDQMRFRYTIEGDKPPWRPLYALDDGRKVYIEFPRGIAQGEMPPLFIVGPDGKTSELVNYRVRGSHMVVDRLFAAAELRLGDKDRSAGCASSATRRGNWGCGERTKQN